MEPGGKDKEENDKDLGSPTLNNSENPEETQEDDNRRRTNKDDDGSYGGECLLRFCVSVFDCFFFTGKDKKDRKEDKFKKNGNIDKLDGVWVPKEKKQQDEQDEDNCIVKCLYVTMTCCECSIMWLMNYFSLLMYIFNFTFPIRVFLIMHTGHLYVF